ncbi:dihydropteroate synthase [Curtobacterium aurantiacum]|uniref:Dihydropteroate synthase n=1 Tax=Curtobacterium aurantiacum TaxID=3236919 RepID=A0ABS5VFB2_9MICO|nr:dihydropteroate synthase [Curtobacterium flaccumfaciens]MBT1544518.1 dihydropteroate synthase [Curtobacterium flaccumfaciens pv. flaccumfaciens]MBT1587483.1 dihydropteroate synthase [Curtobacterium flaccumfaciens pv. flaccumfaciens]MBT1677917.1 dihydropteroate synthase [Curtobacterium flaccumfaciens pv. flaccumfaciens]MBT1681386.1 dihydropteroate synthase [Curtobacterium flaccumfaciens pv. flaccumfaciens]
MTELPTRRERRLAEVSRARAAAAEPATVAIDLRAPQPVPEVVTGRRRDRGGPAEDRTRVLGILNVTPDSFSDGGLHQAYDAAVQHARDLVAAGADVIDVGGESTRPGSERVPVPVEQERVLPVVQQLVAEGIPVSVDTMNAATAERAVDLGAAIVNDVSGGLADPDMARVVASTGVGFVVMHWRGHSDRMYRNAEYTHAVEEVRREVELRVAELIVLGVRQEQVVIDPGLGFAKRGVQNWEILAGYERFASIGLPVLVAASRKRFLDGVGSPEGAPPKERDLATAAISLLAAERGAWGVRVHDPAPTRAVLDVWDAWRAARS